MRALSLWQPWASLWASGIKLHETRDWSTNFRGRIVIQAAQRPVRIREIDGALALLCTQTFGMQWHRKLPLGALVGTCNIIDCVPAVVDGKSKATNREDEICGLWIPDRFAFAAMDFRTFKTPIPWKGNRGWFHVPDDVIAKAA